VCGRRIGRLLGEEFNSWSGAVVAESCEHVAVGLVTDSA
jgi:hypothetical protein